MATDLNLCEETTKLTNMPKMLYNILALRKYRFLKLKNIKCKLYEICSLSTCHLRNDIRNYVPSKNCPQPHTFGIFS